MDVIALMAAFFAFITAGAAKKEARELKSEVEALKARLAASPEDRPE